MKDVKKFDVEIDERYLCDCGNGSRIIEVVSKTGDYVQAADFDDFLAEQGLLEEVSAAALKRVITYQIQEVMKALHIAPAAVVMPERMTTIPEGKTISYAAGYEDALDAVANLNRNTVPLELLAIIHEGLDDYWITTAEGAKALDQLRAILAGAKP